MTEVSRYLDMADKHMGPPPGYDDIERHQQMLDLDDKIRSTLYELDDAKHETVRAKSLNKNLEAKIVEAEKDRDSMRQKVDSLKVKLGVSNANLNKCNDEKEKLRTDLNDAQVLVARLEERLSAASTELDRMRDPANPESNMSIRKHVVNDKKDIKKLRVEVEAEKTGLEQDMETVKSKDAEIRLLEKDLSKTKEHLKECEEERAKALQEEHEERRLKEELVEAYKMLKTDRKTYEQRLKETRIKLGVKMSGRNVNEKVLTDMKRREKELSKQLNTMEKKLKEATGDLDILKNQHKMSKTAMSINKYTKRKQTSRGGAGKVSLAQSGAGPVRFTVKQSKESKVGGSVKSEPARVKPKDTGNQTDRSNYGSLSQRDKGQATQLRPAIVTKSNSVGKGDGKNSVQFVPPPKAKLL